MPFSITCYCMHIFVNAYLFLNIIYSVHTMLLLCIFLWLAIGTGQQISVLFPEKTISSASSFPQNFYRSLCWVKALWFLIHSIWYVHWCYPCLVQAWAVMLERIEYMGVISDITRRYNLIANSPIL